MIQVKVNATAAHCDVAWNGPICQGALLEPLPAWNIRGVVVKTACDIENIDTLSHLGCSVGRIFEVYKYGDAWSTYISCWEHVYPVYNSICCKRVGKQGSISKRVLSNTSGNQIRKDSCIVSYLLTDGADELCLTLKITAANDSLFLQLLACRVEWSGWGGHASKTHIAFSMVAAAPSLIEAYALTVVCTHSWDALVWELARSAII
jgi:hypothetical protein